MLDVKGECCDLFAIRKSDCCAFQHQSELPQQIIGSFLFSLLFCCCCSSGGRPNWQEMKGMKMGERHAYSFSTPNRSQSPETLVGNQPLTDGRADRQHPTEPTTNQPATTTNKTIFQNRKEKWTLTITHRCIVTIIAKQQQKFVGVREKSVIFLLSPIKRETVTKKPRYTSLDKELFLTRW